ncbi:MAG: hypothetical protein ACRC6K_04435 [Fusobacteriaceae bacterium]
MNVISKDKEKGKAYGTMKKIKKKKRLTEKKELAIRVEHKRINAEGRKARNERNEEIEKVSDVKILDFVKKMLIIEIEGKQEKRALLYDKRRITKENFGEKFGTFEIQLYGENWKISKLKNYKELLSDLLWKVEDIFN